MPLKFAVVVLSLATPFALAQQLSPTTMVSATNIRDLSEDLLKQARASKDGLAYKVLFERPDGNEQVCVRLKSGQGEWHHDYADVLIAISGHAQIVTGGKVVNGRESMPGEVRGDSVEGGVTQPFNPGDVLRIEPQVAHQLLLTPGSEFRYFAVKIKTSK